MTDLPRNALCHCKLCACFQVAWIESIHFVLSGAIMILCEWKSRYIIDSKGCTVLCAVSCTKECQFTEC